METLTIKAFRATEDPGSCMAFLKGHRKVLEDFGISNVTTNTEQWTNDPDTYVLIALSSRNGLVGGVRVEVGKRERKLPMEDALFKLDPEIRTVLDGLVPAGTGEVCGLWNANTYSAKGLPTILAFAAVSLANQIGLQSMVCLVAHYTLRHALKVGFTVMEELGDGGTFSYPIPSIKAIAMVMPDAIGLNSTMPPFRQQLLSLRLRPEQQRIQVLGGEVTTLDYQLCLNGRMIDLNTYRSIAKERTLYGETA